VEDKFFLTLWMVLLIKLDVKDDNNHMIQVDKILSECVHVNIGEW